MCQQMERSSFSSWPPVTSRDVENVPVTFEELRLCGDEVTETGSLRHAPNQEHAAAAGR